MANPNLTKENLRTFLRYEFDRSSTATQAFENINNTYREGTIGKATTYRWYEKFNNGEFSVEGAPRSGRPVEFDEGQLEELLEKDNRQTTRELAEQMGCCHGTIENHLKKMGKVQKYGAWVPRVLTQQQKQKRVDACNKLLNLGLSLNA
uniref:Mos1 transposase HTH domain-containing protein n=1 Tax=Acrobeloides nanus TaxID=290746 RepID=A0A914EIB6_9BILA